MKKNLFSLTATEQKSLLNIRQAVEASADGKTLIPQGAWHRVGTDGLGLLACQRSDQLEPSSSWPNIV